MRSRIIFICAMLAFNIIYGQEDIDAPRPTNSILTGLNIGRLYDTNVQLGTKGHSGHHIILFNSYISNSQSSGNLLATGNTKFANSYSSYGSGAGAISFIGNGGVLGFYISDVSTGEDTDITWGTPKLSILRNGNVGIGTNSPSAKFTIQSMERGLYSGLFMMDVSSNPRGALYFADAGQDFVIDALSAPGGSDVSTFKIRTGSYDRLNITRDGNVGIGETNPTKKLVVNGVIGATEVRVSSSPNSDYVFEPDYHLRSLEEVDNFIQENKHLPDIPSAEEFKENGVGLGEMDDMLLRKVEELTLYVIELKKENEEMKAINTELIIRIEKLEN